MGDRAYQIQDIEKVKQEESLLAAFQYFSETSEQLASSYRALEKKVHQLSDELDHSESQRREETKSKSLIESRMKALLDFLPGGVVVLNASGVVVESNPAAKSLLDKDINGELWRKVIAECFSPKNDDGLEVSTRSGRRLSVSTSSLGEEGQIILLTDQTETRKLQEHLSRNERLSAMGKMVSALAHQIRTPLSAAILYAGHLTDSQLDQERRTRFSEKCLSRLHHMERQIRDMLLFVKSELPLNDSVTIKDLENELRAAIDVVVAQDRVKVSWSNTCEKLVLKCHKDALVSALTNLINNAVQSTSDSVDIQLGFASPASNQVAITVADNGAGMNADTLEKIQHLFTTTKNHGTGLGLAVVRAVTRAHGGSFNLQSAEHKGTQAVLTLPLFVSESNHPIKQAFEV